MEESKITSGLLSSIAKTIYKVISFPFSTVVRRIRNRRNVYKAFWEWSDGYAEEQKHGHHSSRKYVLPKILESGFMIGYAYDELKELERTYVTRIPHFLRKKLNPLLSLLDYVRLKYGDARDAMYGSDTNYLSLENAKGAKEEIGDSILDFRDYCRRKLDSFLYRIVG
ncbi:MAG: hypothetical protein NTZ35_01885 [Ignavibacteriales bacterium]|nr:hypothetical protein [Ignavibacteriales bacterium]